MNEVLLAQVRRKLNITWSDTDTDSRVTEIIESAIPDLKHRLGIVDSEDEPFDFSEPGAENTLLLAYCLYEWNHSLHEFFHNYAEMIANTRARHAVARYKSEVTEDETEV